MKHRESDFPTYSPELVEMVRTRDRVELACRFAAWHFGDLEEDSGFFVKGDGSLEDVTRSRLLLLENQLPALQAVVKEMIRHETEAQGFAVTLHHDGGLKIPAPLFEIFDEWADPVFFYGVGAGTGDYQHPKWKALGGIGQAEMYLLRFEGDAYAVPKIIPKSAIEVWWRCLFYDHQDSLYSMALSDNPAGGWDVDGHEL